MHSLRVGSIGLLAGNGRAYTQDVLKVVQQLLVVL
jgi:hypothetical protein